MTPALSPGFELHADAAVLAFFGFALFVAIAALSHEHDRPYSAAIVYIGLGLAGSVLLGVADLPRLEPLVDAHVLERVAELTLAVAVFAAALAVERVVDRRSWGVVAVLICVVMPLTIGAVALFGTQVMGLSAGAALALGAVLAPTDPVLAGGVDLGPPRPDHDRKGEPRFSLHTEAAMNDGLAAPFVVLALVVATGAGGGEVAEWLLADVAYAVGVAAAAGAAGGYGIAAAMERLRARGWVSEDFDRFVALATALLVYGAVETIGAYGLLAAFTAGFAFRRYELAHEMNERVHAGADRLGILLELSALLLLGSMITIDGLSVPGVEGWLLAPLLILVIRPVLVFAVAGPGYLSRRERAFTGLFGVRGVATLLYAALVVQSGALSGAEESVVFWTATAVVLSSVVVHGVAASPLARRLGA